MKRITFFILLISIIFSLNQKIFPQQTKILPLSAQTNNDENSVIIKASTLQINNFIDGIPLADLHDYGFNSRDEFVKIKFENPVKVYTLKDSDIVFMSVYRVPLVIDKEYRSFLTVVKQNDEYKAVDFGATVLAKDFRAKKTVHTIGILRVYEIKTDFLIEQISASNFRFVPIQDTQGISYELKDILNIKKGAKL